MFKILILVFSTWALAASQRQQNFDYYDYIDAPVAPRQQQVARPPPQAAAPRRAAPPRPSAPLPPRPAGGEQLRDDRTTPIPILIDSRRIDTKTGAFVYQYAGADGSEKHEYRYPNGTVVGNYTFINDLGEKETRVYTAGNLNPNHVDETTDPNYVDLSNYDLYKHLEQPYVHNSGIANLNRNFNSPTAQSRPRAQTTQSRPVPRPHAPPRQAPRPVAPRPAPPRPAPAPVPLDFNEQAAHFVQRPAVGPTFDYEDLSVIAAAPVAPPRGPPPPPRGPPPPRAGGRVRSQPAPRPPHRLDLSGQGQGQAQGSFLDSIIRQFQ